MRHSFHRIRQSSQVERDDPPQAGRVGSRPSQLPGPRPCRFRPKPGQPSGRDNRAERDVFSQSEKPEGCRRRAATTRLKRARRARRKAESIPIPSLQVIKPNQGKSSLRVPPTPFIPRPRGMNPGVAPPGARRSRAIQLNPTKSNQIQPKKFSNENRRPRILPRHARRLVPHGKGKRNKANSPASNPMKSI
jgi:hypothetical protein